MRRVLQALPPRRCRYGSGYPRYAWQRRTEGAPAEHPAAEFQSRWSSFSSFRSVKSLIVVIAQGHRACSVVRKGTTGMGTTEQLLHYTATKSLQSDNLWAFWDFRLFYRNQER